MPNPFKPATKAQSRLRLALVGPSGSGKTYSALAIAAPFGKVAVIDTERGSASKYADQFHFDVMELSDYDPQQFINGIRAAAQAGYDVVIIDSLSHAWMGQGGVLEMVDRAAKRSTSSNSFAAWRDVTPKHNELVTAIVSAPVHVIVTMRSKTEYVLEKDERTGKTAPRKVGTAPVQRDGLEYEFDVVADMDIENVMLVTKSRCPALNGANVSKPGAQVAATLLTWLSDGIPMPEPIAVITPVVQQQPQPLNEDQKRFAQQAESLRQPGKSPGEAVVDASYDAVKHLFNSRQHYDRTRAQMVEAGELFYGQSQAEEIEAFEKNRTIRHAEKIGVRDEDAIFERVKHMFNGNRRSFDAFMKMLADSKKVSHDHTDDEVVAKITEMRQPEMSMNGSGK